MQNKNFDIIIIGGGANGLGTALAALEAGLRPLLLEAHDFAKGTSSKSTKLVHGGIRYLAQGHLRLVKEALFERSRLLREAPDDVEKLRFIIPTNSLWKQAFYYLGLKVYQWLSGKHSIGPTEWLNSTDCKSWIPDLNPAFKGGVSYYDAQFNDAELAIKISQFINTHGGLALNYHPVTGLIKNKEGKLRGISCRNLEGQEVSYYSSRIINTTGALTDTIQSMDNPAHLQNVAPSRGTHIVLSKNKVKAKAAFVVPETVDGRIIFGVPWQNHFILGTTDIANPKPSIEPIPTKEEVTFILENAKDYLSPSILPKDISSCWTGLRPLYHDGKSKSTKSRTRSHKIIKSDSGLVSVIGGKWTTFRKIGRDTIKSLNVKTKHAKISFSLEDYQNIKTNGLEQIIKEKPSLMANIHPSLPYTLADIVWHIRNTQCRTIEDYLARRTRILFTDAALAVTMSEKVAETFATELNWDTEKTEKEKTAFKKTASNYMTNTLFQTS